MLLPGSKASLPVVSAWLMTLQNGDVSTERPAQNMLGGGSAWLGYALSVQLELTIQGR